MIDLEEFGKICKSNNALFHSDTVQTIGHYNIDLDKINIDFMTCSAHKFHGPKGVGFAYIKNGQTVKPFIEGGAQERGYRGGTCLLYTSPSPRDPKTSRMPSSA